MGIFLNTGPYEAGNFKPLRLLQFSSDLIQTIRGIDYHAGIQLFVAMGQVLKIWWHFKMLTWESMGISLNVQYIENG